MKSLYQSIAALALAFSLSSCDRIQKAIRESEWGKQQAAAMKRYLEEERLKKEGYALCTGSQYSSHCLNVEQAQELEKEGVKAAAANILLPVQASPHLMGHVEKIRYWKKEGCDINRIPALVDAAVNNRLGQREGNALYYALAICRGKTTISEVQEYDIRFLQGPGKPGAVLLAEEGVKPYTANTFPPNYNAPEILTLGRRNKKVDVAKTYAEVKEKYFLNANHIADLDDLHISPLLVHWYFQLEKTYPEVDLDITDVLALEKNVQEGKITRQKVERLAQQIQEEEPLLDLLRKPQSAPL